VIFARTVFPSSGKEIVSPMRARPFKMRAMAIAITPDGKTAYVACYAAGTVTPIAIATNTPGRPIHVGKGAFTLAITR